MGEDWGFSPLLLDIRTLENPIVSKPKFSITKERWWRQSVWCLKLISPVSEVPDQIREVRATLELLIVSKSLRIKIRRSFRFKIIYSMVDLELQEKEVTQWITHPENWRNDSIWLFFNWVFQAPKRLSLRLATTWEAEHPYYSERLYLSMDGTFWWFPR